MGFFSPTRIRQNITVAAVASATVAAAIGGFLWTTATPTGESIVRNQVCWRSGSGSGLCINEKGGLAASGALSQKTSLNCSGMNTTSTGMLVCAGGGGDITNTDANNRYVMQAGDTMTGALAIRVTAGTVTTLALRVPHTISGSVVRAEDQFQSSGSLTVKGTITTSSGGVTDLGWGLRGTANIACNTVCNSRCVLGFASDVTGANPVACTDATADFCLCAGGT